MNNTAAILARFVNEIRFEDIPQGLVNEAKRLLLDSLGGALAGAGTQKGRIALCFAGSYGSSTAATIIGAKRKASAAVASFANGELFNALDYEALCAPSGHITPYVLAAPLALAEGKKVGGQDLLTAIVISHELAQRVSAGLIITGPLSQKTSGDGTTIKLPIHGYGANIFGGIAGAAKIARLTADKIGQAFGIGATLCPVPTLMQFAETLPASMSKFSPSGWISQAALTAVLLAELGYTGAQNVLDSEFAFWRSFAADGWNPEIVLNGLGSTWFFSGALGYKRYPCCGAMHGALDIFYAILEKYHLVPQDIKEINVVQNLLGELALWKNRKIENEIDAQFSTAYVFAVAAHQIAIGPQWQQKENYQSPEVLDFMKKINVFTPATRHYDKRRSVIEVIVRDNNINRETSYTERDVQQVSGAMDESEIAAKFKRNAANMLSHQKVEQVIKTISTLDKLDDVSRLMGYFRPLL